MEPQVRTWDPTGKVMFHSRCGGKVVTFDHPEGRIFKCLRCDDYGMPILDNKDVESAPFELEGTECLVISIEWVTRDKDEGIFQDMHSMLADLGFPPLRMTRKTKNPGTKEFNRTMTQGMRDTGALDEDDENKKH